MKVSLTMQQFKTLVLQHQQQKRKAKLDYDCYVSDRSLKIRKRCGL